MCQCDTDAPTQGHYMRQKVSLHARIQKILSEGGPSLTLFFLVEEGREDPNTVKPVLSGQSKIDKMNIIMTNGSLMKVKSIAERSLWSILRYF